MQKPNPTGTGAAATGVTETVIDTLRAALDRRIRLLLANLALAFRYIGWPVLLFIATYGLAELSTNSQAYLHSHKQLHDVIFDVLPALGWGLAAVVGLVLSAALMLFRWRVVDNTFRFLGLVGFILLLTFWIFSLALWGVNQLVFQLNVTERLPFSPPSWMTGISLLLLIVFGAIVFARRSRATRTPPAAPTGTGSDLEPGVSAARPS
jgi:hypothetical protein